MKLINLTFLTLLIFTGLMLSGCGGNGNGNGSSQSQSGAQGSGLSNFEKEHGIGPIQERLTIADFNLEKAQRGQDIFESKCAACHQMDSRLVGPPIKGLTERRSAEFIMNIILNPNEMVRNHPEGQKMMQEYMMVMPYQNVSEDEAREIYEYFRKVDKGL